MAMVPRGILCGFGAVLVGFFAAARHQLKLTMAGPGLLLVSRGCCRMSL